MVEQEKQEDIDVDGSSIASVHLNDKFVHTQYNEYRNISNNNLAEADTQASMREKENDDKIMTKDENIVVDNAMTGKSKDIDEQMSKLEIKDTTGTTHMSTRSQRLDADGSIEGSTEAGQVADNESVISEEEEVVTDNSQSMDENDEVVDSEVESVEDSNSEYESESDYESGSDSGSNLEGDSYVDSESDVSDSVPRRRRRIRESLNESDVESEGEDGEAEVLSDSDQEQEQESEAESVYSDDSRSVKESKKPRKTRAHKSKADPRGWYDEKNEGESEGGSVGDSDIEREDRTDEGKSSDAEDDEKKEGDQGEEEEEEEAKPFDIPRAGKFYHHDDRSAGGGRGGGPGRRRRQLWDEDDAHRAEKWSHDMFEEHERTMPPRRNRMRTMHEYNGSNHGRSRQTHGSGYDGKYNNGDREERHGNNQRESRNSRGGGGGGGGRGGYSSGNNRNNNAIDATNLDGDGEFSTLVEPKQAQWIIDALQDNVQPERTHTKRNNAESRHSVMVPANSTQGLTTSSGFGGSMVSDKGSGKKPLLDHAEEYIEDDEEPSGWKPQRYSEARPGLQDKIKNKNAKAGPLLPTKGATALPQQQPQTEEPQSNASAKRPQQQQVQSPSSPLQSHEQDEQSTHEALLTQPSVANKKLTQKQKKKQKNREKKERLREEKRLQKQLQEATNLPENWGVSVGIGMPPPQQNANDLGSQVNAKKARRKEAQQQQRLKNQNQTSSQPDIDLQQQQTIQLLQLQLQLEQQQQQQQRRFQITQQGLVQQMAQQQQLLLSQQARAGDGNGAMASSNTSNSHNGGNGPPPIRSMLNANATEYGSGFNSNKFFTAGRFNDRPNPPPPNQYMPYSPADMNTMPWAQSNDLDLSAAQFMYAMQQSGMNNYLPPSSDTMNGFNPLSMAQYGSMGPYSAMSGGSGGVGNASDLGPPSSDTFAPNSNNQNQFVPNFAMPFGNNSETMNANSRTANDGSAGGQGGNTNVNAGAFVPGSSMHYSAMNTRRGQGQPRKVLTITPPPQ